MTEPLDLESIKARLNAEAPFNDVTDLADLEDLVAEVERLRGIAVAQWRKIEGEWGSIATAEETSVEDILRDLD